MDAIQQNHIGEGDNVAGDKIINIVKSLAPSDLRAPIDAVFEKIRQNEISAAKIYIDTLKSITVKDPEATSLVEIVAIMHGLTEEKDNDAAWASVVRSINAKNSSILTDVCLAALLKLAYGTSRENDAKEFYNDNQPGLYAKSFYLGYYADEQEILIESEKSSQEEIMTGFTIGGQRLQLVEFSMKMASKLHRIYPTYNSRVLLAISTSYSISLDIADCHHLWLGCPDLKKRFDEFRDSIVSLLNESGTDKRIQHIGCKAFNLCHGYDSKNLYEALKENIQYMNSSYSDEIARFKIIAGDSSQLDAVERDAIEAGKEPYNRLAWCSRFIDNSSPTSKEALMFLNLANPSEIERWLASDKNLSNISDIEISCIELMACMLKYSEVEVNHVIKMEVGGQLDRFLMRWQSEIFLIDPSFILKIAHNLIHADLTHKALELLQCIIPNHKLWPSPYVILYMQCLQELGQYKTFREVMERIENADQSIELLILKLHHAEKTSDIDYAINICNMMIELAPQSPLSWCRICCFYYNYLSLKEQQIFHLRIPDSILLAPTREAKSILFFISCAGDFGRAETRWVDWMISDPQSHAVDLVNFYMALLYLGKMSEKVSPSLEQCDRGVQYCCEGEQIIQLIVNENINNKNEYILVKSNKVARFLMSLSPGKTERFDRRKYKLEKNMPPFVACLNIATKLHQRIHDGNDHFVTLQVPSDPDEMVSFFKEIIAPDEEHRQYVQSDSNRPLYFRGHALYPTEPFKAAINFWSDPKIPKSQLSDIGESDPSVVVLDAYSIGYIAKTNLVNYLLDSDVVLVAPHSTKAMLKSFLITVTDKDYVSIGVNDAGNLYRTTAIDVRTHEANTIDALQLVLDNLVVVQPKINDENIIIRGIKDYVDDTVYDAMQLSIANNIPWFCMDENIGTILSGINHALVNVQDLLLQSMNKLPFNFSQRRHALVLYACGALPLPITAIDIINIASTPDTLAGFILFKIVVTHGKEIFCSEDRLEFLLKIICLHYFVMFGKRNAAIRSKYSPCTNYVSHVFNHGLNLYMELFREGGSEFRLATAMYRMLHMMLDMFPFTEYSNNKLLLDFQYSFLHFSLGHFLDWDTVMEHFRSFSLQ